MNLEDTVTNNVLQYWTELYWIIGSALVLLAFGVVLGLRSHRAKTLPGSKGHRPDPSGEDAAAIKPDGYIDSFAGTIQEAGGGLPPIVKLTIIGVLAWWVYYIIAYWSPR